jgi:hypothetical protein
MKPIITTGIAIYRNAIPNSNQIIESIENAVHNKSWSGFSWEPSTVVHSDGSIGKHDSRTNDTLVFKPNSFGIETSDIASKFNTHLNEMMHALFSATVLNYAIKFGLEVDVNESPYYSFLKYSNSQEYVHHMDDGRKSPRRISAVGYLNDNFEGGELDFKHLAFSYPPHAGDIVVFPSGAPYSHAAMPVVSGIKYSVVNWWK